MNFTLKQLQVFVATAQLQSISQAGEKVFISQAAATMSLQELERSLGASLFDRIGKRLQLNSFGKKLLPKALALLDQATDFAVAADSDTKEMVGTIRIAASTTIGNYILPAYLSAFKKLHQNVKFEVVIVNTDQVVNKLLHLNCDIGLIEGQCHHELIKTMPWLLDQLTVFCHPQHPLTQFKTIGVTKLNQYPWIMREQGSGTFDVFAHKLPSQLQLKLELSLNSSEAIKHYILQNENCLACLSKSVIANEVAQKKLVELHLRDLKIERYFYKLTHRDKYQTKISECFQEFLF